MGRSFIRASDFPDDGIGQVGVRDFRGGAGGGARTRSDGRELALRLEHRPRPGRGLRGRRRRRGVAPGQTARDHLPRQLGASPAPSSLARALSSAPRGGTVEGAAGRVVRRAHARSLWYRSACRGTRHRIPVLALRREPLERPDERMRARSRGRLARVASASSGAPCGRLSSLRGRTRRRSGVPGERERRRLGRHLRLTPLAGWLTGNSPPRGWWLIRVAGWGRGSFSARGAGRAGTRYRGLRRAYAVRPYCRYALVAAASPARSQPSPHRRQLPVSHPERKESQRGTGTSRREGGKPSRRYARGHSG